MLLVSKYPCAFLSVPKQQLSTNKYKHFALTPAEQNRRSYLQLKLFDLRKSLVK
jgi:hypothetical protein